MKKIITPEVKEKAIFMCDKHPDRECYTEVKTLCWYGSKFDLLNITAHLCDECMEEFYKTMKEKFGVEPKEEWI